jgi:threonine dehydrogenase-like Zn-dependent dehydrogenase
MLAARAYEDETELRLEEVDRPSAGVGDVVIEVKSAGLPSGVLRQWQLGRYPILPRTLGHEAAGLIAEVGPGVEHVSVGDRVRLHPNLSCQRCEYCLTDREQMCSHHSVIGQGIFGPDAIELHKRYLHGCLAEHALVPAHLVDHLPDEVSFDAAAKVHDLADALRAWKRSGAKPGDTIVLTAATGTIGVTFVRMARLLGIGRIVAVARSAERLAAVQALDPSRVEAIAFESLPADWEANGGLTEGIRQVAPEGVDAVIDFLPEGAGTWQATASLKRGGTAVLMGTNMSAPPFPGVAIMGNCWQLVGTRGCTREDARQVLKWLEDGSVQVDDLVTHRFSLPQIGDAVRTVRERTEPTWLVVVQP